MPSRVASGYESPVVTPTGAADWRTVTVTLPASTLNAGLPGKTDLAIEATTAGDAIARFVRVIRLDPPR